MTEKEKALAEALSDMVYQHCTDSSEAFLDSFGLSSNKAGMEALEDIGWVEINQKKPRAFRSIIGTFTSKAPKWVRPRKG